MSRDAECSICVIVGFLIGFGASVVFNRMVSL